MNTLTYTTPAAAGAEVHTRAERHMSTKGSTYQEAVHVVLAADKQLAEAYAQPAARVATTPAVPVTGAEEREILDWVLRAVRDGMEGALPGELGALALEAAKFKRIGMSPEEAARRAMGAYPHLVTGAKLLLGDIRKNAPENKPVPTDEANSKALAQGKTPGETVHLRTVALMDSVPSLNYQSAVNQVLAADPALKSAYARS